MIIGIDLGTTNSLVAIYKDGRPELIPNRLGEYLTPSVISVTEDNEVLVGKVAREYGMTHPLQTARLFKRSMGTEKIFTVGSRQFNAEELSGLVLKSLKEDAENYLGCKVEQAIISVPAYFNEFQRKATKQAGEIAGLEVVRIINEPTAAALAYGVGTEDKDERCLVFDLGGGTFDISIIELFHNIMEVHAIAGDNFIGGEDFTKVLANMFLERQAIAPESLDVRTLNRVIKAAEVCKCQFATSSSVTMTCVVDDEEVSRDIRLDEYEEACGALLERMRQPIERSLRDAGVRLDEIDRILMVGGATRLPIIRNFVAKIFRRFPSIEVDPDTAIAQGAAITCGMKERNEDIKEVILTDVCPYTLGTEVMMFNGVFDEGDHYLPIIERNTTIPVSRTQTLCTCHDNQERVVVNVLQGESRIASNNITLGTISVPVPKGPKGKESVDVTYTYDVNSLLEVEVKVNSTGVSRKIVIQGAGHGMSEEEIQASFEKLAYLKRKPRDEEINSLVLSRGERLYEELLGEDREAVNRALMSFGRALDEQDRTVIERRRKECIEIFDRYEYGKGDGKI